MTVPPRPRQPWLHDLHIAVDGNATALSGWTGDLLAEGAHGLYVDDERVLSRLEVLVAGEPASPVAAEASGSRAEFVGAVRRLGDHRMESTVDLRRSRSLAPGRLTEVVTVSSRAADPIRATLRVSLAADGAPVSAVVTGEADVVRKDPARPQATGDGGAAFVLPLHRVEVGFDPGPDRLDLEDTGAGGEFDLVLQPGAASTVTVTVAFERTAPSLFDADPGSDAVDWSGVQVVSDDPRLGPLVAQSLTDLRHLLLRDPLDDRDVFAAAGSPWYLTLFGRDSIWTARMLLPFGTEVAAGTLRTLARRQGTRDDPGAAEQPGKIPHEVRRAALELPAMGLSLPPVYYGTVDATALWVTLLVDAWRCGVAEAQVRELLPALRSALEWVTGVGQPDKDGLLKYLDSTGHGLANQGWKDSPDAIRHPDGGIATGPIALVEAQAYAVEALLGAADLLDALGEDGGDRWRAAGEALAERVRASYWVQRDGLRYLAMALDGSRDPVQSLGSNMGHVLGTGALTPAEARHVADALASPDLRDRFGLRTLGERARGFNPIGYHTGSIWTHDTAIAALGLSREGLHAEATALAATLVEAGAAFGNRLPELYSGQPVLERPAPYPAACRPQAWSAASGVALVTVGLGLRPDVPGGVLRLAPQHHGPFAGLRVDGLRWGEATYSVSVGRSGEVAVDGLPESVSVEVSA